MYYSVTPEPNVALVDDSAGMTPRQGWVDFMLNADGGGSNNILDIISAGNELVVPASITDIQDNVGQICFMFRLAQLFSQVNGIGIWLNCDACTLTQTALDALLHTINIEGSSNGSLKIAGSNPAPTGGTSNADLMAIIGRGYTVTHN